eukprot:INCI1827.1.p1 GENE.INCI1827.1~~INCI1827.1.p1  ORF type:complete len:976 (+),score=150.52 INCI1827.1:158-3085(+)
MAVAVARNNARGVARRARLNRGENREEDQSLPQGLCTLWFEDSKIETQHRQWQMGKVAGPSMFIAVIYAFSNACLDDYSLADKHPLVHLALVCHVALPICCAVIFGWVWATQTRTMKALALFELAVVCQILADGFSQAILAGYRGLPIPAGVFGVACITPLTGQSWVYNTMLSITVAILYYIAQAFWHPDLVDNYARMDSARAFVAYIVVGYLSDKSLRIQSQARYRLRGFNEDLKVSVAEMISAPVDDDPSSSGFDSDSSDSRSETSSDAHTNRSGSESSSAEADSDSEVVVRHPRAQSFCERTRQRKLKKRRPNRFIEMGTLRFLYGVLHKARNVNRLFADAEKRQAFFLASMSHELRTPLQPLINCARMLRDTSLSPDQLELLQPIISSGKHLLKIVNDILDFSKLADSGKFKLECGSFDPVELSKHALKLFLGPAEQKRVRLTFDDSAFPTGVVLFGDETRIQQILVNLLSNAVKFTPADGVVTLRISARPVPQDAISSTVDTVTTNPDELPSTSPPATVESEPYELVIAVMDSGVGMTPEAKAKLFQPYVQVGPAKREGKGTGLGLCISAQLAKLMGCPMIEVESEVNRGTVFTARLKLPRVHNVKPRKPRSAPAPVRVPSWIQSSTPEPERESTVWPWEQTMSCPPASAELPAWIMRDPVLGSFSGSGAVTGGPAAAAAAAAAAEREHKRAGQEGCPKGEAKLAANGSPRPQTSRQIPELPDCVLAPIELPVPPPGESALKAKMVPDLPSFMLDPIEVPFASDTSGGGGTVLDSDAKGNTYADFFSDDPPPAQSRPRPFVRKVKHQSKLFSTSDASSATHTSTALLQRAAATHLALAHKRILLVEDVDSIRKIGAMMMRKIGGEVIAVENGREAVHAVRAARAEGQNFDFILMDLRMPEMDGLEATEVILAEAREARADVSPIIGLTADVGDEAAAAILNAGAVAVLTKPYVIEELLTVVKMHTNLGTE